ncbi:coniferyl aldehyde dehydrogenase [Yinghuangia aomiensis]|uniref:Aldehyde dehydrogenase n=1 Tax=Yinghuangia aomiensis TaxID=676205 RepID=A0ABP9HUY5_9ACTN
MAGFEGLDTVSPSPAAPGETASSDADAIARLKAVFGAQKQAARTHRVPSVPERQDRLAALAGMVVAHRREIQDAMIADFGVHPRPVTDMTEVLGVAGQATYIRERLPEWAAAQARDVDPALFGTATARIQYEPKGVLGILAPWNFPFLLSLGPLADMLGAGNRVVIKPSEVAPACADLLSDMVARTFDPEQVAVVTGGLGLAKEFPTLRWDHLLYTGNAGVGREVAVAAAGNLVPVTLELGGKNPAVVAPDRVDAETVAQILGSKLVKSGQVCIAPDYCLVPRDAMPEFVALARTFMQDTVPSYAASDDCVGIVSERHTERLLRLRAEAERAGCEVVDLPPGGDAAVPGSRQLPVTLILDPGDDLGIMREELFGPLLPVKPYDSFDDAVAYVNSGEPPLGLYVFSADPELVAETLARTRSGGACVNTCAIQGVLPSLGFGGAGHSGYGRHRGVEGFREFSIARGIVERGEGDLIPAFFPPYAGLGQAVVDAAFGAA